MNPNFNILTDADGMYFVGNRENGKWILTNNSNSEKIKKKISKPFIKKPFQGVSMIALNMGRQCNFNCNYCLVGDLKEDDLKLTKDVGMKTLERIAELDPRERFVVFHGNEPMMNYSLIKELVLYEDKLNKQIKFCMQSNGSLFNDKNLVFLKKHKIGIGISLDGLRVHQDKTRTYKNEFSTYESVKDNMLKVIESQGKTSVITVVTKDNVEDLEDIVKSFEDLGVDSVLFCPVSPVKDYLLMPNQDKLIHDMQKLFDRFLQKRIKGEETIRLGNFRNYLRTFFKPKTTSNCLQCGAGPNHPLLAVDIDGSIYPCDYFWGNEKYKIGNIFEMSLKDAINSEKNFRVYRDISNIEECRLCNWKMFCGGGCPGGSLISGRGLEEKSLNCDYNKKMLTYVAKKILLIHSNKLVREILEG